MKITDVISYVVPPSVSETSWVNGDPWVLIEVRTDAGINGWGQAYTPYDREQAIARKVRQLGCGLEGKTPFEIRRFMNSVAGWADASTTGIEVWAAAAGIEIALWDIVGKALDTPVHCLLGGACKDHIHLYANCWSNRRRSPSELASFAEKQVKRGFRAVKVYPFLHDVSVRHGIACLDAVRSAVGPDVLIFVDMLETMPDGCQDAIFDALCAREISWLEDPASVDDIDKLAAIRRRAGVPVVAGEELYSKRDFARLCDAQALDILNLEVALLGILGVSEISAIAGAYAKQIAVHNANTMTIGLSAAVQAAAIVSNSKWVEFFPTLEAGSRSFSSYPFKLDDQGAISISREAGLGVQVDRSALDW